MRISDWSSDVCSSDLLDRAPPFRVGERAQHPIERGAQSSSRVRVVKPPAASHSSALFSSTVTQKVQICPSGSRARWVRPPENCVSGDRKSVVWGKSVSVSVDLGGSGIIKKKNKRQKNNTLN